MHIDEAKGRFDRIASEATASGASLETEGDARLQLIDRILIEALGWRHADIRVEPHVETGFVDYLLRIQGANRFVVEAKRTATPLTSSQSMRAGFVKVSGPTLLPAEEALRQAQRYCLATGVPFAAVTTGLQWVAYWAVRTDGVAPTEGRACVFPSLESIAAEFQKFFELFSRTSVASSLYRVIFRQAEGTQERDLSFFEPVIRVRENRLLAKSSMVADLHTVFRKFFSNLSGDDDPEMLARCFVESKESREADATLSKITRDLLSSIVVEQPGRGGELQREIEIALDTKNGEFVLIIGNKGAGKSTFIDRFFRHVLDRGLRERCLVLRVDLADSSGDVGGLVAWLVKRLKESIENALFKTGSPSFGELKGAFIKQYDRWRHGEHKSLFDRDQALFDEMFGAWLAEQVTNDTQAYIMHLMRHAIAARSLMPCLIFDNADHFPQEFQEAVFQFAQSIFRELYSFVICPITDRTIWQLSKAGPFQSYDTRALYLPVPSAKDVLARRIDYLKERCSREAGPEAGTYFLTKGIRLRIPDIAAFAASVEDVFVSEEFVGRWVAWLANHDIRRSLKIAERVVTSPVLSIEQLVHAHLFGKQAQVPRRSVRRALLLGDHVYFSQENSDFILNLFAIDPTRPTTPLGRLSLLRFLIDRAGAAGTPALEYVEWQDVEIFMTAAGISEEALTGLTEVMS